MLQAAFYRADVRDTCPLSSSSLRGTGTATGHCYSQLRGISNKVRNSSDNRLIYLETR
jgi:hypothetical protein